MAEIGMDTIKEFFTENDQFAAFCGIELIEVDRGRAVARMTVEKRHCNGVGTTHGGAIVTLADFAFAAACNSHGTVAVAININSSFYKATRPGDVLTAEASEDTRNPKLGSYAIRVTDGEGDLVAGFQAMAYRKKNPLPLDI